MQQVTNIRRRKKRERKEKENVHTNRTLSIKIDRLLQLNERREMESNKENKTI